MAKIEDVLKVAKPVERSVFICVAGHVAAEYEQAVFDLSMAQDEIPGRLSGEKRDVEALNAEVTRLGDIMREHTFEFKLRALSALKWSNLLNEHPDPNKQLVFHEKTFVPASIAACTIEPEGMDDPEKVTALLDVLSPAQQSDLFEAVWEIHQTSPKGLTS